jgi:SAM-dependent methyltransferase
MAGRTEERFIPALRFRALTPLFDRVVGATRHERVFKRRVLERAAIREGEAVLDLACGTGTLAIAAARAVPGARITGVDGDPDILRRARTKAEAAGVEISLDEGLSTELPYGDGSFDVVLSTLFFHHLSEDAKRRSMQEVRRVVRPGGRIVIGDVGRPQDPLMRVAVLGVRVFDGFDVTAGNVAGRLPGMLRDAGLEDVGVRDRMRTPLGTLEILTARGPELSQSPAPALTTPSPEKPEPRQP